MLKNKVIILILLNLSFYVQAASQVTDGTIVWVGASHTVETSGTYVVIKGGLWSGSSKCNQTTKDHPWYFIENNAPMENQMISIALTSLASSKNSRVYGNGNCSKNGFEKIKTIYSISNLNYK